MVTIFTNREEFFNDIADEVRAFLGMEEARLLSVANPERTEGLFLRVILEEQGDVWAAHAFARFAPDGGNEQSSEFTYHHPVVTKSDLERKRYEKRAIKIAAFRALHQLFPEVRLPWGSLTGIRPTKLLRELEENFGETEACRVMEQEFDVSNEKLDLARRILSVQKPILQSLAPHQADVYIGIPFCKTRCLYCSFAAETLGKTDKITPYLAALKQDISMGAAIFAQAGYRIRSLYIGGGTPTVLSAGQLEELIRHTLSCYGGYGQEFTVEAGRPDTINREKLDVLCRMGVGRISINPQSMRDTTLACIGRSHSAQEIIEAYRLAKEIGFSSINMDIIAGLPGETLDDFRYTLDAIGALSPNNLTIHTLAIKRSSRLKQRLEEYPLPPAHVVEEMVRLGATAAKEMGLVPYYMYRQKYMQGNLENVGYAAPGHVCIYNIDMMEESASIMAHGAGAMTKCVFPGRDLRVERIPNPKDLATYMAKISALAEQKRALFCSVQP